MTETKRGFWVISMLVFLHMTTGCATTTLRPLEEELARPGTHIHDGSGQKIEGYLLHDGTLEEFKGRVRVAEPDSLYFWSKPEPTVMEEDETGELFEESERSMVPAIAKELTIETSTVKALDVYQSNPGGTVGLVLGLTVLTVGALYLAAASSYELTEWE